MIKLPTFNRSLLHPRYWLMWFGIGVLYLLVLLPYPIIYWMGTRLGRLSMHFLKSRVKIAQRNIELSFPQMNKAERHALLIQNFESVGMGLFETGMAWFWPDWRIKRWVDVSGAEHVHNIQKTGQGIILIGVHFMTLELGARIFGLLVTPGIGVYRPNDNPLIDWLQTWGRKRSNKSLLDRSDLKGMIRSLKKGDLLWYAPDHDYGPRKSVFVPFFAVEKTATTTGTSILMKLGAPSVLVPFTPRRLPNAKGYQLIVQPAVNGYPLDDEIKAAAFTNKLVEKEILQAPDQYMWLHRRFKTRPEGETSLYDNQDNVH